MNVGDRVTVVWGFPPETWIGDVVSLPNRRGIAQIHPVTAAPGVTIGVPSVFIDHSMITVARSTGHMHRANDPETARLAAAAAAEHLTDPQWRVLCTLVEAGPSGLIDHEHEARNNLAQDTAGARRKQLERLGLTEPTGQRRLTPRGSYAGVHRATARGIAVYQQHRQEGAACWPSLPPTHRGSRSARCSGVDPDLFFPARGEDTRAAKAVCAECPVKAQCLDHALDHGEKFGIWGGLSERERRRIRSQRARDRGAA